MISEIWLFLQENVRLSEIRLHFLQRTLLHIGFTSQSVFFVFFLLEVTFFLLTVPLLALPDILLDLSPFLLTRLKVVSDLVHLAVLLVHQSLAHLHPLLLSQAIFLHAFVQVVKNGVLCVSGLLQLAMGLRKTGRCLGCRKTRPASSFLGTAASFQASA